MLAFIHNRAIKVNQTGPCDESRISLIALADRKYV